MGSSEHLQHCTYIGARGDEVGYLRALNRPGWHRQNDWGPEGGDSYVGLCLARGFNLFEFAMGSWVPPLFLTVLSILTFFSCFFSLLSDRRPPARQWWILWEESSQHRQNFLLVLCLCGVLFFPKPPIEGSLLIRKLLKLPSTYN
jgi:hypothetical protein